MTTLGFYEATLHSARMPHREGQTVEITQSDVNDEINRYENNHGEAPEQPDDVEKFIVWWNDISEDTTCHCGVMPKIELIRKL